MRADAGVVISASHNPYQDNGIKIFGADGFKLPDAEEAEIEALMDEPELDQASVTGDARRQGRRSTTRAGATSSSEDDVSPRLTLDGLRIVVDARTARPTASRPPSFEELGAEVFALGVKPNGKNINDKCGALHPEHMRPRGLERRRGHRHRARRRRGPRDRRRREGRDRRRRRDHGAVCARAHAAQGKLAGNTSSPR
jgi:phosphoglucosamine mutase